MADFGYSPDFNYRVTSQYNVLRNKSENWTEQRRLISDQKIRTYDLQFTNRLAAEMTAAISFFDSKYGSLTSFTIEIGGETITGIFIPGSFQYSRTSPNSYSYQFKFSEVVTS